MNTNQLTLRERNEAQALSRTLTFRRWTYAITVFVVGSLLYFTR